MWVADREAEPLSSPQAISRFLEGHFARYFSEFGDALPPDGLYDRVMREVEVPLISAALSATVGNQLKAADLLGINRNTLRSKMRAHGLRAGRGPISAREM